MINFYSFAPEIFLLILILSTLTLGLINKGSSISLNVLGFAILSLFLIFNGSTLYLNKDNNIAFDNSTNGFSLRTQVQDDSAGAVSVDVVIAR